MKRIQIIIAIIIASLSVNAQDLIDPDNGVKLYMLIKLEGSNQLKHYSSFEDIKKLDFNKINYLSIENRGRKTNMDTGLLYNLFNKAPNLSYLLIGRNVHIEQLPDIEKENNSLNALYLTGNNLKAIPGDIDKLKTLKLFSCIGNNINALPPGFTNLKSLNTLLLSGNQFKDFPVEILELQQLTTLSFKEKADVIPNDIYKLSELKKVEISTKRISLLPTAFSKLKKLKFINLSGNNLEAFPSPLLKLQQLKYISLANNPIDKASFIKSIKGLKSQKLTIYSSLSETDRLELGKLYPEINFVEDIMPYIESVVFD